MADATTVLPEVQFGFSSTGDPATVFAVVHAHVSEGLSEVYEGVLDLATVTVDAALEALLDQPCTFTMGRPPLVRSVRGVVRRVDDLGVVDGAASGVAAVIAKRLVRVYVVPALWRLSQRVNYRVFQNKQVVDVVREVFRDAGVYQGALLDDSGLQRRYAVREYCVQFRESELAFVLRLLENDGITFYFRHDGATETLVLTDALATLAPVATFDGLPIAVRGPEQATASVESIRHFHWFRRLEPTRAVLEDYDFTRPAWRATSTSPVNGTDAREVFDYPGPYTLGGYSNPAYSTDDGAELALDRMSERVSDQRVGRGESNVTGLTPGFTFESLDFPAEVLAVTHVEHSGHAPELLLNDPTQTQNGLDRYHNEFHCVAVSVPYRPARSTPQPSVRGPQTATVVGPAGEEIYTDEHGRIKIQFHCDRRGTRDEHSSAWVRVGQVWAGRGWGFMFIPRINMEVIVHFLDGDPDRPLVTGCVYNGDHDRPYALPAEKTKSTIKTKTSPGPEGADKHNELRFEDLAGHEEVFIHAQKDFNEVVEHDHTTLVKRNQGNHVRNNQSETIGCDQSLAVGRDRTKTVGRDETVTVERDESVTIKRNRWTEVQGFDLLHVVGNQDQTVDGPGGAAFHVTGEYNVDATEKISFTVDGTSKITMLPGSIEVENPTRVTLKSGGSTVTVTPGKVALDSGGGASVELDGANIKIKATGNIDIEATAFVNIKGAMVRINS